MSIHPDLKALGRLRPGIHSFTVREIQENFCFNKDRKQLFKKAKKAIKNLISAKVEDIYIGGSFVEDKESPNDIDICWRYNLSTDLDKIDPLFLKVPWSREKIKEKYSADVLADGFLPAPVMVKGSFLGLFLMDRNNEKRGVIKIKIE